MNVKADIPNKAKQSIKINTVLIVDDHPLYGEALSNVIKSVLSTRRIVMMADLLEVNKYLVKRVMPKLVFLDLNLPGVTGISGLLALKKKIPQIPIIIISATSNADVIQAVHDAGAAGYISKAASREELEEAILTVSQGQRFFADEVKNAKIISGDQDRLQEISERLSCLTPQQSKILQMICEGMLNKQIAYELELAEATVKAHITAMMRKLSVHNRTQAALLAHNAMEVADLQ